MNNISMIAIDDEVIDGFKKVLYKRLAKALKDRISWILLGVEAFNTAAAEGKSQDDCLIAALDLTAANEISWSVGLDTFNGSIKKGKSVQEALERAINIALSMTDVERAWTISLDMLNEPIEYGPSVQEVFYASGPSVTESLQKNEYLKNIRTKTKSLLGNSWQTMKTVFGKDKDTENKKNTEGGERV